MAAGDTMTGVRAADVDDPRQATPIMKPGEYRLVHNYPPDRGDVWECCTPNGMRGNLARHDVTEHDDGTITVSPSILVTQPPMPASWHGYLEHGVWREA